MANQVGYRVLLTSLSSITIPNFSEWLRLRLCLEKMIRHSVIPENFNTSIIKPLIKDQKVPTDSVTNLRPVVISDEYNVINEKVLLENIKLETDEHEKQFGFKPNSSCSRATFMLNQLMSVNKHNMKELFILAIDLSEAFDKVYRSVMVDDIHEKGECVHNQSANQLL